MEKKSAQVGYSMNVLLLDPFHSGSHAQWSKELKRQLEKRGKIKIELRTLTGRHWKWRMNGSAAAFAFEITQEPNLPDVILTTDMMDVAAFRGLLPPRWRSVKIIQYFHENQLTYPWNPSDPDSTNGHNRTYGFLNIQSALAADHVWFNSNYHREKFLEAIDFFLSKMPDYTLPHAKENIANKSTNLPIGISSRVESRELSPPRNLGNEVPAILWNHRWEYDKAPDRFFALLKTLKQQKYPFQLILLGQQFHRMPEAWESINLEFSSQILHKGWAKNSKDYHFWLSKADFLLHMPRQEYFGISVLEAMRAGVIPLVSPGHAYDDWMPKKFILKPRVPLSDQLNHLTSEMIQNQKEVNQIGKMFDWSMVVERYEKTLLEIVKSSINCSQL